jgi:hypothetical protein
MATLLGAYSTGSTGGARIVLAAAIAPFVSSVVTVAITVFLFLAQMPGDPTGREAETLVVWLYCVVWMVLVFGAPVAYAGMALIGFPAWLLLRLTRNESGAAYAVIGAVGGWWIAPMFGGHKWDSFPLDLIGLFAGGLTLILFWRIAKREPGWP